MATNDPNKPDNATYIDPGNKTPEEKAAPAAESQPKKRGGRLPKADKADKSYEKPKKPVNGKEKMQIYGN